MTNEQTIELANQAGITFITKSGVASATEEWIVEFAKLIRNEVLEEAAKVCDDAMEGIWQFHPEYVNEVGRNCCTNLAKRIRGMKS